MLNRYHVPRSFLQPGSNDIVLFEQFGGDPSKISFVTRQTGSLCAQVSEAHPAQIDSWISSQQKMQRSTCTSPGMPERRSGHQQHQVCKLRDTKRHMWELQPWRMQQHSDSLSCSGGNYKLIHYRLLICQLIIMFC